MTLYRQIIVITGLTMSLSACLTPVITDYYVTPALSGQLLDSETKHPIVNMNVYLTDEFQTNSDSEGKFNLPAMVVSDDMNKRRSKDNLMQIYQYADVMIEGDGYQRLLLNIDGIALPTPTFDTNNPVSIDMGRVYLTPLAEGEHVYDSVYQYVETITYCKPNESQKKVNCIPVPEGKTYEQASPNQLAQ